MRAWQFSRPKGPGFGIVQQYYLSILCCRATMPSLLDLIHPKGEGGAVEGFGVPLSSNKTKDDLQRPLERGAYALASRDRKTVLKLLVLSKEEAMFDPEAVIQSRRAPNMKPEAALRMRATWTLGQLTFESHDPNVYPAVNFQLQLARRLAYLTEGVVADPISWRYLLPDEVLHPGTTDAATDPRDVVSVQDRVVQDETEVYTLGLQKFGLPELQIPGILDTHAKSLAEEFLLGLVQSVLSGKLLKPGAQVGARSKPLDVAMGGHDIRRWEGIPVLELLPPKRASVAEALAAWKTES
jgi:hypothetical protein